MGKMMGEGACFGFRLADRGFIRNRDVAEVFRRHGGGRGSRERQNVGRTALVSITAVERLAFRGVDKAQCHDGIIRQCGGGPASKKIP